MLIKGLKYISVLTLSTKVLSLKIPSNSASHSLLDTSDKHALDISYPSDSINEHPTTWADGAIYSHDKITHGARLLNGHEKLHIGMQMDEMGKYKHPLHKKEGRSDNSQILLQLTDDLNIFSSTSDVDLQKGDITNCNPDTDFDQAQQDLGYCLTDFPNPTVNHGRRDARFLDEKINFKETSKSSVPRGNLTYEQVPLEGFNNVGTAKLHPQKGFYQYVKIKLGDEEDEYKFLLDTGSLYTWVFSQECTANDCKSDHKYDDPNSDNSRKEKPRTIKGGLQSVGRGLFNIYYYSGHVVAHFLSDRVRIGGFDSSQFFSSVFAVSDDFLPFNVDGILGLPAKEPTPSSTTKEGVSSGTHIVRSFLNSLSRQKLINRNIFAVNFPSSYEDEGSLTIGGVNDTHYEGDITYSPVISTSGHWVIEAQGIAIDGFNVPFTAKNYKRAVLDTGTGTLAVSQDDCAKIHERIPGSWTDGHSYYVDCTSSHDLSIQIQDQLWTLSPDEWICKENRCKVTKSKTGNQPLLYKGYEGPPYCATNIKGLDSKLWILGVPFFRKAFVIFDVDNQRVGLAKKVDPKMDDETPESSFIFQEDDGMMPKPVSNQDVQHDPDNLNLPLESGLHIIASSTYTLSLPPASATGVLNGKEGIVLASKGRKFPTHDTSSASSVSTSASIAKAIGLTGVIGTFMCLVFHWYFILLIFITVIMSTMK